MTKRFKVWCDSGANIHSCRTEYVTLDDLGLSKQDWDSMSEEQKEEAMRDIAFDKLDWGWAEE